LQLLAIIPDAVPQVVELPLCVSDLDHLEMAWIIQKPFVGTPVLVDVAGHCYHEAVG
jgi:hypothetical protein